MTAHKPLLIQKDRRGIERIPVRDFLTPVLQWSGAPSQVEMIDISIGGAALEYTNDAMGIDDVFHLDLKTPDGLTVKNLRFDPLTDVTKETPAGTFETTLRGRFLDLTDTKFNQLKRIVYHSYQHYRSQIDATGPLHEGPATAIEPAEIPRQKSNIPEGVIPICSSCKRIRDTQGTWHTIESFIRSALGVNLSHSICPKCAPRMYPWLKE